MSTIRVVAESDIAAPAERVWRILTDYHEHHPKILPPAFSNLVVEEGGVGAGTRYTMTSKVGGRTERVRHRIDEPEPGRVLRETDLDRDMETTFTVTPSGDYSHLCIETVWNEGGFRGWTMRLLAPRLLLPIYREELRNIDRYAQTLADD